MRGLILAAGRGSRMGPLGDDRPKCMVELDGRPLLDRQIAALRRGGVEEVGIVRGYRAEILNFPGLAYFDNPRWSQTNMVMSLAAAASWLRAGPVIVSYADIFYRGHVVRGLAEEPGALVISFDRLWRKLWSRRFADPLSDAETFRDQSRRRAARDRGSHADDRGHRGSVHGSPEIHAGGVECRRGDTRHARCAEPGPPRHDGIIAHGCSRQSPS